MFSFPHRSAPAFPWPSIDLGRFRGAITGRWAAFAAGALAALAAAGCGEDGEAGAQGPPTANVRPVSAAEASRFLSQASFGPTSPEIDRVSEFGFEIWLTDQFDAPATVYLGDSLGPLAGVSRAIEGERLVTPFDVDDADGPTKAFWRAAILSRDQLRQRMVFALSQILVVSDRNSLLRRRPQVLAGYMDILSRNAFGNYRDLLEDVTYSYAMADYLTYYQNTKGDPATGRAPDENYARELMQLFTVGLVALKPDGEPVRLANGEAVEIFDNEDITGLARVFTGLSLSGGDFFARTELLPDKAFAEPLEAYADFHSEVEKSFLGLTIPAGTGAEESIERALDYLFNHPNTAPFICRQLIQRFVTSSPRPAYVERVSHAFADGIFTLPSGLAVGTGRRGDLKATIAAILFDEQARSARAAAQPTYGKLREPVIRFAHYARAFALARIEPGNERFLLDASFTARLAQHPFRAPSVFNFYRPNYVAPGTATGAAKLTAPELQILNADSAFGYANFLTRFVEQTTPKIDVDVRSFRPDFAAERALAEDPRALVDRLDLLLTHAAMTNATRARIVEALELIEIDPAAPRDGIERRVVVAIVMAMTCPEYIVMR